MKISVDTNVLVRSVVRDDPTQAQVADETLRAASLIAVSLPCLCEFVWVLQKVYRFAPDKIALAIRALLNAKNIVSNHPAVEAGLTLLEAGGDFPDGIMAYEGARLGGEVFFSFDRKTISLLKKQGFPGKILSPQNSGSLRPSQSR